MFEHTSISQEFTNLEINVILFVFFPLIKPSMERYLRLLYDEGVKSKTYGSMFYHGSGVHAHA